MRVEFGTLIAMLVLLPLATDAQQRASEGAGSTIFGNNCANCHGKLDSAPPPAMLKQMTPERIYQALTTGDMKTQAQSLTDQQKIDIAEWTGGRKLGATESGDAKKMTNRCASNPPIRDLTSSPSWNGWGSTTTIRDSNRRRRLVCRPPRCRGCN